MVDLLLCTAQPAYPEVNNHRHGRWTGLFKLAEECGELVVAAIDLGDHVDEPEYVAAFEDELGDVSAACRHAMDANALDKGRMSARTGRQVAQLEQELDRECRWPGRDVLIRRAGILVQLLGKIAAFPDGDEHPDGCGNLKGRLEVAIADLVAIADTVTELGKLNEVRIERRHGRKLGLFRMWFPVPREAVEARPQEVQA
jgi:hypothetical protein